MYFLEVSCFFYDPMDDGNLISGSSAFSKFSLNIWKFSVHLLLKPGLENFEHFFDSVWDECNCVVVWTFFGIAFLWNWNENWPFPVFWSLLSFQIFWHIECSTFTALSFRTWNTPAGIPSPPLALFIVMLPKALLTSHSRISGSRWVITSCDIHIYVYSPRSVWYTVWPSHSNLVIYSKKIIIHACKNIRNYTVSLFTISREIERIYLNVHLNESQQVVTPVLKINKKEWSNRRKDMSNMGYWLKVTGL